MTEEAPLVDLKDFADFKMGETIIAADCTGDGTPIYSADTGEAPWNYSTKCRVRNKHGAIVIGARGSIGHPRLPPFEEFAATQTTIIVDPNRAEFEPTFLLYTLKMVDFGVNTAQQAVPMLTIGDLRRVRVRKPKKETQRRIAEILTTEDEAMEQTEALAGKLEQMKAGLMHDLFTRGVTPDGHLRPTRQEAPHLYHETPLGWLPKEWEVKSLGHLSEIVSGVTLGSKLTITGGVRVPYLRVANVQDGYLDLSDVKHITVTPAQLEKLALKSGDVLMNEGGDFDKLGRGSVWQEEITPCVHQNHVFRVRPKAAILRSYFLAFWSQSEAGKRYFLLNSKQSTNLASINSTQLHKFPVALPKLSEQEQIEGRIAALKGKIDIENTHLAKIRQQKQGLMQDLLTGRVPIPVAACGDGEDYG